MSNNFSMGFSCGCGDEFDKVTESEVPLIIDESKDVCHQRVELDVEFRPVEHPMEPQDEDRPVKCPMPASSLVNDGRMSEERFAESLGKRTEEQTSKNKEGINVAGMVPRPPIRAVRKRQHTLTQDNHITRMPPLPNHNVTIYQMLQQFHKFES